VADAGRSGTAAILQQVRAEQVRTLFKQSAPVLLANVVNAAIVSLVLWSHAPHRTLVVWTAAMTLMAVARIEMRRRYWQHEWNTEEQEVWGNRFTLGSLCAGLLWGFLGGALLPDSLPHQVVVVFVIGGMAAGAAGTISCFMRAYYAYLVPSLLPVMARLLAFGGEEHLAMVAMLVLFMGALSLVARNVQGALVQAFRLRFENAVLLSQVSEAQASLVRANEGLSQANEMLEGRVRERTVELRESQRELAEIVRESPDGIVILDDTGAIVTVNPAAERISGRRADEFMGAHFAATETLVGKDMHRAIESFQGLLHGEQRPPEEFEVRRPDGQTAIIEVNPRVVVGVDGRRRVHSVIRDVTERHRVQRLKEGYEGRLREAQRLESVGMLAGGVAHDFNNVLTMILSNAEALASAGPSPEAKELLDEIRHGSLQAAGLTQQLLAFSRQQVLNVKPTNLAHLLHNARPMLERALGEQSTLVISVPAEPIVVLVDAIQLEQAIINLLVNAKHAMPRGGRVEIEVQPLHLGTDANWPDVPPGEYAAIAIADTGVGMDPATCARIFDPFFTTKELGHGTGLGLSTVHGIVKQAGGQIRVTSEPGHGSRFEVLLPHHGVAASEPPKRSIPDVWTAGSGTVLVVEDQLQVQRAARRILTAAGYLVLCAESGEQALRLVDEYTGRIDLLITDVIMPGLSGVELSRRLLELDPALAVLLVSGYAGKDIAELAELGADVEFLQKPFDAVSLTSSARAALARRGKGADGDASTGAS
jgi:two-component system cell cycle sensor histidine kinase/response regulator CckA